MKYLRRYLSLLFALVMCVGLFSVTAHAEEVEQRKVTIETFYRTAFTNYEWVNTGYQVITPGDGLEEKSEGSATVNLDYGVDHLHTYLFEEYSQRPIAEKDKVTTFTFSNLYLSNYYPNYSTYLRRVSEIYALVNYTDGTSEYVFENVGYSLNGPILCADFTFTPSKQVESVKLFVRGFWEINLASIHPLIQYLGEYDGDGKYNFSLEVESQESGLLKGILGKLGDGFANLGNKLTDVFNSIVELPQKLWNLISDGLKNLFVPSEESMTAYKDKWDELLASRFGAVYQVVNIMTDSWDGIMQADETDTINFPSATLNFSGSSFSFGGYDVKIVPDGFGVLVTAIKSIVAIVCTVAFVNGMRKRYDEIMGVEQ